MITKDEIKQQIVNRRIEALIGHLDQAAIDAQRFSEGAASEHMKGYYAGHRDAFALAAKWLREITQCQP